MKNKQETKKVIEHILEGKQINAVEIDNNTKIKLEELLRIEDVGIIRGEIYLLLEDKQLGAVKIDEYSTEKLRGLIKIEDYTTSIETKDLSSKKLKTNKIVNIIKKTGVNVIKTSNDIKVAIKKKEKAYRDNETREFRESFKKQWEAILEDLLKEDKYDEIIKFGKELSNGGINPTEKMKDVYRKMGAKKIEIAKKRTKKYMELDKDNKLSAQEVLGINKDIFKIVNIENMNSFELEELKGVMEKEKKEINLQIKKSEHLEKDKWKNVFNEAMIMLEEIIERIDYENEREKIKNIGREAKKDNINKKKKEKSEKKSEKNNKKGRGKEKLNPKGAIITAILGLLIISMVYRKNIFPNFEKNFEMEMEKFKSSLSFEGWGSDNEDEKINMLNKWPIGIELQNVVDKLYKEGKIIKDPATGIWIDKKLYKRGAIEENVVTKTINEQEIILKGPVMERYIAARNLLAKQGIRYNNMSNIRGNEKQKNLNEGISPNIDGIVGNTFGSYHLLGQAFDDPVTGGNVFLENGYIIKKVFEIFGFKHGIKTGKKISFKNSLLAAKDAYKIYNDDRLSEDERSLSKIKKEVMRLYGIKDRAHFQMSKKDLEDALDIDDAIEKAEKLFK